MYMINNDDNDYMYMIYVYEFICVMLFFNITLLNQLSKGKLCKRNIVVY